MAEDQERMEENGVLVSNRFLVFLFLGFALVVAGIIVLFLATWAGEGSASFSGFIFIGPFPIVFGVGPDWIWLVAVGIAISALSIIVFAVMRKRV